MLLIENNKLQNWADLDGHNYHAKVRENWSACLKAGTQKHRAVS
jgi:hypothetical protein